jgi:tetratricopeptide (TPR) repeat protein
MRNGHILRNGRLAAGICAGLALATGSAAADSSPGLSAAASDLALDYDGTLLRAKAAEVSGDLDGAQQLLRAALPNFPQDIELPLQLAWVLFRGSRFAESAQFYRLTLTRTAGGGEAELGLGWALQKQDECQEAISHFRAVLATQKSSASAKEGLGLCIAQLQRAATAAAPLPAAAEPLAAAPAPHAPALWARPLLSQGIYVYRSHPTVRDVAATNARLETVLYGHAYLGADYRYSRFLTGDGKTAAWNQSEIYLDAGYTSILAGVTAHYALSIDGSGYSGKTSHIGISGRYSGTGDLIANLSASFYSDSAVLRGELTWRVPIYGGFSIRPGGALQWSSAESFRTLQLSLNYDHRWFSLWFGGKYGDEKRAVYLDLSFVYNSPARVPYGLWSGIAVRPGAGFALSFNYGYDLLRTDSQPAVFQLPPLMPIPAVAGTESAVNYLTLALAKEF